MISAVLAKKCSNGCIRSQRRNNSPNQMMISANPTTQHPRRSKITRGYSNFL